jgi:hypothetical protein
LILESATEQGSPHVLCPQPDHRNR